MSGRDNFIKDMDKLLKKYKPTGIIVMAGFPAEEKDQHEFASLSIGPQEYLNTLIKQSIFKNQKLLLAVTNSVVIMHMEKKQGIDQIIDRKRKPKKGVN